MPLRLLLSDPREDCPGHDVTEAGASWDRHGRARDFEAGAAGCAAAVASRAGSVPDLAARRAAGQAAEEVVAEAPVRHLPAALLEALQGSWGTPDELLGHRVHARRLAVAR